MPLQTEREFKDYLAALEKAREFYRRERYEEGWDWILHNKKLFPEEKLSELFVVFVSKIANLQKEENVVK